MGLTNIFQVDATLVKIKEEIVKDQEEQVKEAAPQKYILSRHYISAMAFGYGFPPPYPKQ